MEEASGSTPSLPPDLLLAVLSRCDYETLVRCAASSKFLCRCMRDDPVFLRRRPSGFAPSLLLGVLDEDPPAVEPHYLVESPTPSAIPREPVRSLMSSNAGFLRSFGELVACDRGLVVLRRGRRYSPVELCVCNPITGRHCFVPPPVVDDQRIAILTGEDVGSGSQFQLLAAAVVCGPRGNMCVHLQTQLFSSSQEPSSPPVGAWGPVRRSVPPAPAAPLTNVSLQNPPVVISGTAHWLCQDSSADVLALRIEDGRAEMIKGPREVTRSHNALLAVTGNQRLSLVAAYDLVISVMVLSHYSDDWELHATVSMEGIPALYRWMRLDCFGQRSGIVVICVHVVPGRFLLNLETKEVMHMPTDKSLYWQGRLFEMDLQSLIAFILRSPSP